MGASALGDAVGGTIVGGEMLSFAFGADKVTVARDLRRRAAVLGLAMSFIHKLERESVHRLRTAWFNIT
jgi:hypothetical protein